MYYCCVQAVGTRKSLDEYLELVKCSIENMYEEGYFELDDLYILVTEYVRDIKGPPLVNKVEMMEKEDDTRTDKEDN